MNNQIEILEKEFKNTLQQTFSEHECTLFLNNLTIVTINNQEITLAAPSAFVKHSVEDNYLNHFKNIFKQMLGTDYTVFISVKTQAPQKAIIPEVKPAVPEPVSVVTSKVPEMVPLKSSEDTSLSMLNEKYTFDNFIIGENNNFAANAAIAVAKNPGTQYNPLLLYSGVGLGKTHLIQAIGNHIYKQDPNKKIIYISAEEFGNEFVRSLSKGTVNNFKQKYRKADVLLIDDIHFFQEKEAMQEELFHTFNSLYDSDKQIVFTCDRPVTELKGMTDRLRSRFSRGMNIDLKAPKYETRISILQQNLLLNQRKFPNLTVPPEVIDYIAKNVKTNVRDLESAFTTLAGYSDLIGVDLSIEIAQEKLKDTIAPAQAKNITIEVIMRTVAEYFGMPISDFKSKKRKHSLVHARNIGIFITRTVTDFSTTEIGAYLNKDHTTIMHSCNRIRSQLQTDSNLEPVIERLKKQIIENHSNN